MKDRKSAARKNGLRERLLMPLGIVLAVVPLINLLAFNFFINRYVTGTVREQLSYTAISSKALIKKELSDIVFETDKDKIGAVLLEVNKILRTTKTSLNVELMLFAESGELLYPSAYKDTFLNDTITGRIRDILEDLDDKHEKTIKTKNGNVSVMGYRLSDLPITRIPYVVFVSSLDVADTLIATVNRILIIVLLGGLVAGIAIVATISEKIVRSVYELRDGAKGISLFQKYDPSDKIDTDELKELAESISDASERIIRYDGTQKSFLQNASHEIRTPLMSIQGYAEGIEKNMFDDPSKAASVITEESIKLSRLLDELLMISRIDNGNYDDSYEMISLKSVFLEYEQRLTGLAFSSGKEIVIEKPDDDVIIKYNDTLFSQILLNVVSNGLRYAGKKVVIKTHTSEKGSVAIEIEDDGPGIDSKDLTHVFERFYKGKGGQTGLGLAIALTAAQALGGSIVAENGIEGAKFTIRLPIV